MGRLKCWKSRKGVLEDDSTGRHKRQILIVQGNLTNFHSQKYSGITNSKVCHLEVGGEN
jgi:hypothetical protein